MRCEVFIGCVWSCLFSMSLGVCSTWSGNVSPVYCEQLRALKSAVRVLWLLCGVFLCCARVLRFGPV